jgi:GT2 family glycosyltransferase
VSGAGVARASVIVATTRDGARLERCLGTLERATRDVPYELVVVLNGADADVREVARRRAEDTTVVDSDVNLGFPGACNLGRASATASADAIVLLHDDVEVEDGWLSALLRCADDHPEAGVIAPRVLGPDGRVQLAGAVMFRDGTPGLIGAGADRDAQAVRVPRVVDFASSSCLLVRAAAWDAVGGLDEHYFPAGYSDADLGFGVRRAGWDVRVEHAAAARHSGGSTLPLGFKRWLHTRNRARFLDRWREELADHEPLGDGGPGAIERALRRARSRAASAPPPTPAAPPADLGERRVDPARLPAREVSLMREYLAERDVECERLEAEVSRLAEELRRIGAEHAGLHEHAGNEIRARQARIEELDAIVEELRGQLERAPEAR